MCIHALLARAAYVADRCAVDLIDVRLLTTQASADGKSSSSSSSSLPPAALSQYPHMPFFQLLPPAEVALHELNLGTTSLLFACCCLVLLHGFDLPAVCAWRMLQNAFESRWRGRHVPLLRFLGLIAVLPLLQRADTNAYNKHIHARVTARINADQIDNAVRLCPRPALLPVSPPPSPVLHRLPSPLCLVPDRPIRQSDSQLLSSARSLYAVQGARNLSFVMHSLSQSVYHGTQSPVVVLRCHIVARRCGRDPILTLQPTL